MKENFISHSGENQMKLKQLFIHTCSVLGGDGCAVLQTTHSCCSVGGLEKESNRTLR